MGLAVRLIVAIASALAILYTAVSLSQALINIMYMAVPVILPIGGFVIYRMVKSRTERSTKHE